MRIVVHRGARQIGGTCIEVSTERTRLIFDAGLPLDVDPLAPNSLPPVAGLWSAGDSKVDALFLTHAHADHSGLVRATEAKIPVYVTDETSKILLAGALFARQPGVAQGRTIPIQPGIPVKVGDLLVTPFAVDHSTVGAVAFLIEDGRRRVFYSGDLRFHGRRPELAKAMERALTSAPLDVMLIEGTRFGERAAEENESEAQLLKRLASRCGAHQGPIFVCYSPLHVDRFRTFHDLAQRIGRRFVIDPYQDFVLHLLRGNLPRPSREGSLCTLLMPKDWEPRAMQYLREKTWLKHLRERSLAVEELKSFWQEALVLYRPSMDGWLCPNGYPSDSLFLYSYWTGYLKEETSKAWLAQVAASHCTMEEAHASGHAHPDDLARFVHATKPDLLVPVHTRHPEEWAKHYSKTRLLNDGDVLELG